MTNDHCHSSSLLTLALLLFLSGQLTTSFNLPSASNHNLRVREECRKLQEKNNCSCSQVLTEFEISCPALGVDPKIAIRINPNNYVQIDCHHLDPLEYSLLPRMTIGNNPTVQIRQCPLPPRQSINGIFQRLGITHVKRLLFESNELGGPLERIHIEGLQDLGRLRLSSKGLTHLPEDLFTDFKNLTWLDLRSNKVELPLNIFASLENLNALELGNNNLHNLPPGIFRNQKQLTQLNLWGNNLTNLTRDTFEGVSSITELDLSGNNIVTLRPDVFSLLTNLTNINLNGNYFESLPYGLFSENKNLSFFRLYDNRVPLKQLPAKLLGNLPSLREVRLSCGLETIPADLFVNSTAVRNITISGNNLTELPLMLFADQIELIDLDLSRNQLLSVPDEIFTNARNLLVLRLSHNRLVNITNDLFTGLVELQMLYVDDNNLLTIYPGAFTQTLKLSYINMQDNQIELRELYNIEFDAGDQIDLSSPFQSLTKLQTLNLRNNSIRTIFRDWKQVILNLRTLDLSFNNITMIVDSDLQYLSRDIFVNLSHNAIQKINFKEIEYLDVRNQKIKVDLSSNPIECDCVLLSFVQFLRGQIGETQKESLQITTNELQCSSPKNLQGRGVSGLLPEELLCPLDYDTTARKLCPENCSCFVRPVDRMAIVNCSNANLTEMPTLPDLKHNEIHGTELYIENNKLTKLPSADTRGYMDVVELHAANNSLTEVLGSNLPKKLKFLNLSRNKIQYLNESVLSALNGSQVSYSVALAGNPWACDCDAQSLLRYVQLSYVKIRDLKQMQCVDGQKFQDLSLSIICPVDHVLIIALCVLIAVVGLCAGIIAGLYYKYQKEIKVWLYARGMCLWFVTEEELDKDKKYDAFVSYSHRDEDFITDYLLPELESGPTPFKLCLHIRDWIIGEFIPNQIVRSVDDSRRTIVVLSPNFIESIWARMEFRAAHTAALNEGRARVIVIIYGDIGSIDSLDPELKAYLQMNTYVKWGDPWFWKKLRYAMPHPSKNLSGLVKTALKSSVDDKLELIKPSPVTPPLTTPPAEQASRNPLMTHLNGVVTHAPMPNGNGNVGSYTNGKIPNGHAIQNGHINGAFIINTSAKQSDV